MAGLASGLINGPWEIHIVASKIWRIAFNSKPYNIIACRWCRYSEGSFCCCGADKPVYIRLTGGSNNPIVYHDDINFKIGKAIEIETGNDLTIFATGTMVFKALKHPRY